jgi:hypothetical protein
LARAEVGRLNAVVRLLSERLAKSEANAASAEVARRLASGGRTSPVVNDSAAAPEPVKMAFTQGLVQMIPVIAAAAVLALGLWKARGALLS